MHPAPQMEPVSAPAPIRWAPFPFPNPSEHPSRWPRKHCSSPFTRH
jgi:hypothetical protein